jgi:hypothetical protein
MPIDSPVSLSLQKECVSKVCIVQLRHSQDEYGGRFCIHVASPEGVSQVIEICKRPVIHVSRPMNG